MPKRKKVIDLIHDQANREQYLINASQWLLDEVIMPEAAGQIKPLIQVSMAFPKGARGGNKVIGQCWKRKDDSSPNNIFINPQLNDTIKVLATLAHELIHAVDFAAGHKGEFARMARAIGLEGKLTATYAGADLTEALADYVKDHGEIPHIAMDDTQAPPKQKVRNLPWICEDTSGCGFNFRTSNMQGLKLGHSALCPVCQVSKLVQKTD
jgi:hypothetical protein